MKITQITKSALLIFTLFGVIACSSTSEETDMGDNQTAAETGESGVDATTRRTRELADAAAARAAEAAERMARSALATTVFYFDFDVAEFRGADRDVLGAAGHSPRPRRKRDRVGQRTDDGTQRPAVARPRMCLFCRFVFLDAQ